MNQQGHSLPRAAHPRALHTVLPPNTQPSVKARCRRNVRLTRHCVSPHARRTKCRAKPAHRGGKNLDELDHRRRSAAHRKGDGKRRGMGPPNRTTTTEMPGLRPVSKTPSKTYRSPGTVSIPGVGDYRRFPTGFPAAESPKSPTSGRTGVGSRSTHVSWHGTRHLPLRPHRRHRDQPDHLQPAGCDVRLCNRQLRPCNAAHPARGQRTQRLPDPADRLRAEPGGPAARPHGRRACRSRRHAHRPRRHPGHRRAALRPLTGAARDAVGHRSNRTSASSRAHTA